MILRSSGQVGHLPRGLETIFCSTLLSLSPSLCLLRLLFIINRLLNIFILYFI